LREFVRKRGINGKIYEVSAITYCVVCKGVIVLSLTDQERNLIPYSELVGWFYELNAKPMQCIGKKEHVEDRGWGYYWSLDQILEEVYPRRHQRDAELRGGRQHFGVPVIGMEPKVHIIRTCGPFSVEPVRFTKPPSASFVG